MGDLDDLRIRHDDSGQADSGQSDSRQSDSREGDSGRHDPEGESRTVPLGPTPATRGEGGWGDDLDPEAIQGAPAWSPNERRRAVAGRWGVVVLLVVLLAAAAAWWWLRRESEGAPETATPAAAAEPVNEAPPEADPEPPGLPVEPLPEVAASDPFVRSLVETVSSNPSLLEWLGHDRLVRRFVLLVSNVAFAEDPSVHVPFLRPSEPFAAEESRGTLRIAPATYARFATLAAAVDSLDVAGSAEAYRRLEPLFEEVFAELGYPGTWRGSVERAARRVLSVPVLRSPPLLEEGVVSYRFVDPELEELAPPEKALLRMGPEHLSIVQRKVRALAEAIGLSVP